MNKFSMTRKAFFRIIGASTLLPVIWLWDKAVDVNNKNTAATTKPTILKNISKGVNFVGEFIVVRFEGKTQVFSSRCTHAGCIISRIEGDELVCGCHGSRYDSLSGAVKKGPSVEDLRKVPFKLDKSSGDISIQTV
jgi:Rieske Fe-S protein